MPRAAVPSAAGPRTRRRTFGLTGAGLLLGALGGWLAGMLKAPRKDKR